MIFEMGEHPASEEKYKLQTEEYRKHALNDKAG